MRFYYYLDLDYYFTYYNYTVQFTTIIIIIIIYNLDRLD